MIEIDPQDKEAIISLQTVLQGRSLYPRHFPNKITLPAMKLFEDTLIKGVLKFLFESGGWKKRPSLERMSLTPLRVWEKYPNINLEFEKSFFFLHYFVKNEGILFPSLNGDELFLALLMSSRVLNAKNEHNSALCCLLFPFDPLTSKALERNVDWNTLVTKNAWMIEGLYDRLRDNWVRALKMLRTCSSPEQVVHYSQILDRILKEYLNVLEKKNRKDLATFLVEAGQEILCDYPTKDEWLENINWNSTPMSRRQEIRSLIGIFFKYLGRIGKWAKEEGLVSYYEDNYTKSQILLSCWAPMIRENGFLKAETLLSSLEEIL